MGASNSIPASSTGGFQPSNPDNSREKPPASRKNETPSNLDPRRCTPPDLDFLQMLSKEIDTQLSTILSSLIGVPSVSTRNLPPGNWVIIEDDQIPKPETLPVPAQLNGPTSGYECGKLTGEARSTDSTPLSPTATTCPDPIGASLQHSQDSPPFPQLETFLRRSPYSPLKLEQQEPFKNECLHPAGRFWLRDAFEDLLRARTGESDLKSGTKSEEDYETEIRGRDWVRGVQGRWLRRWAEDRGNASALQGKSAITQDDYERFLASASGGAEAAQCAGQAAVKGQLKSTSADKVAKTSLQEMSLRTPEVTRAEDSPTSTTTRTRRTVGQDGVIRTKTTITQKFWDGREEISEEVTTDRSRVKPNLPSPKEVMKPRGFDYKGAEEGATNPVVLGKKSASKSGWFWK